MPKARLTALKIENMKPPKTGQQDVFDQGYPGFGIRLSYAGAKTFFYHFKLGGKSARIAWHTSSQSVQAANRDLEGS